MCVLNYRTIPLALLVLTTLPVLVAEVTQPSLGVGYEIGRAIDMNKRILCLFRPDSGRRNATVIVVHFV